VTDQPIDESAEQPADVVPPPAEPAGQPADAPTPEGAPATDPAQTQYAAPQDPPPAPPPPTAGYAPLPPPTGQAARPTFGPPGKQRGIGVCILLAIVTIGIYTYVWVWLTQDEIKRHSGQGVGGPLGFVIYLLLAPVTFFLVPNEVRDMMARAGQRSRVGALHGLWILLPLAGPIIWFVQVQGQLNEYWRTAPAPTAAY
jgi:hypothetical protein